MLTIFAAGEGGLRRAEASGTIPPETVWIDMPYPGADDVRVVEAALGIELPSHEDMQEIELSSRLYQEDGALFMTAVLLAHADTENPVARPVTFVLAGGRLVTLRHSEPASFQIFARRAARPNSGYADGQATLLGLLDVIVDRAADILERLSAEVEALSREIFESHAKRATRTRDFQDVLRRIGRKGDLNSKARESLLGIGRLLAFLTLDLDARKVGRETKMRVKSLTRDVLSLTDHVSFLSNKINFLLDATLGMINIEQNAIIKIFSVAAVAFLPPTLIASIYGMNFDTMPELSWPYGYPAAIGLMVLSAVLPYYYFKRRGWL